MHDNLQRLAVFFLFTFSEEPLGELVGVYINERRLSEGISNLFMVVAQFEVRNKQIHNTSRKPLWYRAQQRFTTFSYRVPPKRQTYPIYYCCKTSRVPQRLHKGLSPMVQSRASQPVFRENLSRVPKLMVKWKIFNLGIFDHTCW